ncbi:hypothetical protein NNO07_27560 [Pseudomonas resinovorans]|uniref:Lipoprotein n=1 Tax=Metapseudomonas resinovorans TaxID=53412 RepID=A0ABT4YD64_METRE|nr:hypothetical protein [Pseudomonas resinovorans]MDA8486833.1 hypothetical protein [Pseudomonas resinovorans]
MIIKFRRVALITLAFCVPVLSACADTAEPQFEDYKVDSIFAGPNHEMDAIDQNDDKWTIYRRNAIKRKVNFAGHYILYTGDCGGGAICGEILDAKTGKIVSGFPNAYQLDSPDGSYYDAGFRPESRLLVISGVAADPEKDQDGKVLPAVNRTRYFEFKSNELVLIKSD